MARHGRPKNFGPKLVKHKKVTVEPAERLHSGKITSWYRTMENLIKEKRPELKDAKIGIMWRKGWPTVESRIRFGELKIANDSNRAQAMLACSDPKKYEDFDFFLYLNSELYRNGTAGDESLAMAIHHCLLCGVPALDNEGNQKTDEAGRLCWKRRRPVLNLFPEYIKEWGIEKTIGLSKDAIAALADANRPLLAELDKKGEENTKAKEPTPATEATEIETRILFLSNSGKSMKTIAKELSISERQVRKALGKL